MFQSTTNQTKLNRIIPLIFLILIIQSCEEILQIKIPDSGPMITVNCILNEGEPIQMRVSESQPYPPITDTDLVIKNAIVKLYEDDVYIEDLVYQETFNLMRIPRVTAAYHSLNQFRPRTDHSYSIKVSSPGFPDVNSSTYLPNPVPIISIDTSTVFTMSGPYQYKTIECKIKFRDPPGIRNYYKLSLRRTALYYLSAGSVPGYSGLFTFKQAIPFLCHDLNAVYFKRPPESQILVTPDMEMEEAMPDKIYIADDSFDGKIYELIVMIPVYLLEDMAFPQHGEKFILRKINFELSSINEEYYKYARSNYIQFYKKNDFFSEPCYVYNNINNGTGIFSGSSASVDSSIIVPIYYYVWFNKK
ncbi:MAG: DUF4249 domain-containing protein [Bacteroidales bacterium]|nr:DUF4249 domain-containing protein [Bacteroidales bacterium]